LGFPTKNGILVVTVTGWGVVPRYTRELGRPSFIVAMKLDLLEGGTTQPDPERGRKLIMGQFSTY